MQVTVTEYSPTGIHREKTGKNAWSSQLVRYQLHQKPPGRRVVAALRHLPSRGSQSARDRYIESSVNSDTGKSFMRERPRCCKLDHDTSVVVTSNVLNLLWKHIRSSCQREVDIRLGWGSHADALRHDHGKLLLSALAIAARHQ